MPPIRPSTEHWHSASSLVFPELMTTGYHRTPAEARKLGETPDGLSLTSWAEALAGSDAVVAGGFCETGADGNTDNPTAVVSAGGAAGRADPARTVDLVAVPARGLRRWSTERSPR